MRTFKYIVFLFALVAYSQVQAAKEQYLQTLRGTAIYAGASLSAADPYHTELVSHGGTWPALFKLNSSEIEVRLYFDDAMAKKYSDWTLNIIYKIICKDAAGNYLTSPTGDYEVLSINYNNAVKYTDMVVKKFPAGSQATVKIVSVSGLSPLTADIYFDVSCNVDRYYPMNTGVPQMKGEATANNTFTFNWRYITGAEWYELEYLFVDYGEESFGTAKPVDFANATRVVTSQQNYVIPMTFPRGKLFYRVRGAGYSNLYTGIKTYSQWSMDPAAGTMSNIIEADEVTIFGVDYEQYYEYNGFESDKNWQYAASYSENGKRADNLAFMDGLMRNRQSLTMNQQENRPILSETVYDFTGRPAVQFLPSPVKAASNQGLKYYDDLNNAAYTGGDAPYDYRFFDTDSKTGTPDVTNGSVSNGAAYYYSSSNTSDPGFNGAYIPDAEGYPYVRTQYRNDGTDRVKSQSGVGEEFKPNSDREIKIWYGSPASQQEIDRLFGNEAGYVNMYSKEVVQDANGQKTVKYIDNEGRVVATALSGTITDGRLHDLDSRPETMPELTSRLHTFNELSSDNEWIVNHSFVVAVGGEYNFSYTMSGDTVCNNCIEQEVPVEVETPHCANCKYDVEIVLTDNETGDSVFSKRYYDLHDRSIVTASASLSPGSYTIYKKLKLHEDFVMSNLQYFLDHQDCVELMVPDGGDCAPSCSTMCEQSISYIDPVTGNTIYFEHDGENDNTIVIIAIKNSEGEFDPEYGDQEDVDDLLEACLSSCAAVPPPSAAYPCDIEYQQLVADMSPGGQYFDNLPDLGTGGYNRNEWLEANVTLPPLFDDWDEVRELWIPSFGDDLVVFHPEYCAWKMRCEGCNRSQPDPDITGDDYREFYMHFTSETPCFYSTTCTTGTVNNTEKYFNPTAVVTNSSSAGIGNDNQGYQPFDEPTALTDIAYDPLLLCLDNKDHEDLKLLLDEMLKKFLPADDGCSQYYSIWYVLHDPDGIAYDNGNNTADPDVEYYFDLLHGNSSLSIPGLIGTGTNQISEAEFFKRAYMLFREKILQDYTSRSTTCDLPIAIVAEGKDANGFYVRYPANPVFSSWPNPYTPCGLDDMAATITASTTEALCEPYVEEWMEVITEQCTTYTSPQLTAIENGLYEICQHSDAGTFPYNYDEHATGTVTVNSISCSTFVQVAQAYGCTIDGEFLPEVAQAYNQGDCACSQFKAFLTAHGFDYNSDKADVLEALVDNDLLTAAEALSITQTNVQNWLDLCEAGEPDGGVVYSALSPLIEAFQCPATDANTQDGDQWIADCNAALDSLAAFNAQQTFNAQLETLGNLYKEQIYRSCLDTGVNALTERFTMTYVLDEFHYTLYFYDQAGNLVKTVSPEGVERNAGGATQWTSILDNTETAGVAAHRATGVGTYVHPDHQLITNYKYNSLNQLIERTTADEGQSKYFYDYLGRLVASQNAKQAAADKYSIVMYDELSREILAFVGYKTGGLTQTVAATTGTGTGSWLNWVASITGSNRTEITEITYDEPLNSTITALLLPTVQQNLRNRIACVSYTQTGGSPTGTYYDYASHYSYDIHGNVQELVQDNQQLEKFGQNYKRMKYAYELVSGNVTQLSYQEGKFDQFYHQYHYDANNMLEEVYTSKDGQIWERDADYFYQPTGQLARMEQGQRAVNGQDYTYTLQGWLKGVNSNTLNKGRDPGKDGNFTASTEANKIYGLDVMGYTLGYYQGDYKSVNSSITGTAHFEATTNGNDLFDDSHIQSNLYNGNIGHVVVGQYTTNSSTPTHRTIGKAYEYDQLNRLKFVETAQDIDKTNNDWDTYGTPDDKFREAGFRYDGNGNILSVDRYGSAGTLIDDLTYRYNYSSNHLVNNRLHYVDDTRNQCTVNTDIDDQASGNYTYNEIGQLKSDAKEYISEILWYERGKVRMVIKDKALNDNPCMGGTQDLPQSDIEYLYDGMGHKIGKIEKPHVINGGDTKPDNQQKYLYTWYVNDAEGNVLSIYKQSYGKSDSIYNSQINQEDILLQEADGMYNPDDRMITYALSCSTGVSTVTTATLSGGGNYQEALINVGACTYGITSGSLSFDATEYIAERASNLKQFELNNHLGTAVTVTSDRKRAYDDGTPDGTVDRYIPEINSWSDTYAFGGVLDGGQFVASAYRYGFNGVEKNKEWSEGNYDFGARIFDSRIGRFFSPDPLSDEFSDISPYSYASNNPIYYGDIEGESPLSYLAKKVAKKGIKKVAKEFIKKNIKKRLKKFIKYAKKHADELQEFAEEADELLSSLDNSWWETLLEFVPVAGDVYGAYDLGKDANRLWTGLENLNKKVDKFFSKVSQSEHINRVRKDAVRIARKDEIAMVQSKGYGTREWSKKEMKQFEKGKFPTGYAGHHGNSVKENPWDAGTPDNIHFKTYEEHLDAHDGNWKNPTTAPHVDRSKYNERRTGSRGGKKSNNGKGKGSDNQSGNSDKQDSKKGKKGSYTVRADFN